MGSKGYIVMDLVLWTVIASSILLLFFSSWTGALGTVYNVIDYSVKNVSLLTLESALMHDIERGSDIEIISADRFEINGSLYYTSGDGRIIRERDGRSRSLYKGNIEALLTENAVLTVKITGETEISKIYRIFLKN
jgi:hypothetical protein